MKRFLLHLIGFLLLNTLLFSGNNSTNQKVKDKITGFFEQTFDVPVPKIFITYLRFPDLSAINHINYQVEVFSQKTEPRLGYQTLWVKLNKNGRQIKKFPVSLEISIEQQVLVCVQKIKRHASIHPQMLTVENMRVDENWNLLVHSIKEVTGMESKRVLRRGTVLTKNLLRPIPIIHRGDVVKVQIETASLLLSSPAVAKGDGGIGETVLVESKPGGKKLKGLIKGPGLVIISQEMEL